MIITTAPRPPFGFHPLLWAGAAALLLIPAAAMLFSREMSWGPEDFAEFGVMLTALCLAIEAAWYWPGTPLKRFAVVMLAVLAFLTVWAELAVGLFD
jgi:hypothetical protein